MRSVDAVLQILAVASRYLTYCCHSKVPDQPVPSPLTSARFLLPHWIFFSFWDRSEIFRPSGPSLLHFPLALLPSEPQPVICIITPLY